MTATSPQAIQRKLDNRKSSKDLGREKKIAELGGTPLTIHYGQPLEDSVRVTRTAYLFDLMYPKRHTFVSSGKTKLTEAEVKRRSRVIAADRYRRAKDERGEVLRGKLPNGSAQIYTPWYILFQAAKNRATRKGVPFTLEQEDIKVLCIDLTTCPVLGIELGWFNTSMLDNSPSLDRIIPSLGYVKGNIAVISQKANRIKNDATAEELGKVYSWLNKQRKE